MLTPRQISKIEREAERRGCSPYKVVKEKINYQHTDGPKSCGNCRHLVGMGGGRNQCWFIGVIPMDSQADVDVEYTCNQWDYIAGQQRRLPNGGDEAD